MIDTNLTTAIVSASGSVLVAVVAILANNSRFGDVNKRIDDLRGEFGQRLGRVETKLEHIEQMLATYCLDVARIKERLDIK